MILRHRFDGIISGCGGVRVSIYVLYSQCANFFNLEFVREKLWQKANWKSSLYFGILLRPLVFFISCVLSWGFYCSKYPKISQNPSENNSVQTSPSPSSPTLTLLSN